MLEKFYFTSLFCIPFSLPGIHFQYDLIMNDEQEISNTDLQNPVLIE